jgi:hypothetical protein
MAVSIISFQGFAIIFILSACVDINIRFLTFSLFCSTAKKTQTHTHTWQALISAKLSLQLNPLSFVRSFDVLTLAANIFLIYFPKRLFQHVCQCVKTVDPFIEQTSRETTKIISNANYFFGY